MENTMRSSTALIMVALAAFGPISTALAQEDCSIKVLDDCWNRVLRALRAVTEDPLNAPEHIRESHRFQQECHRKALICFGGEVRDIVTPDDIPTPTTRP